MPASSSPLFVCLDSAHWSDLTRDLRSPKHRAATLRRVAAFEAAGGVLVFTFHHLLELAQYENEAEVVGRFEALRELSSLAVVASVASEGPGAIMDVVAHELVTVLEQPESDATAVAAAVRDGLMVPSTGAEIADWVLPQLSVLHPELLARAARSRATSAVSQAQTLDRSKDRLDLNAKGRSPADAQTQLNILRDQLAVELRARKSKKSSDAEAIAAAHEFIDSVVSRVGAAATQENPWDAILAEAGVTREEAEGLRYVRELTQLAQFRRQLEISAKALGIAPDELVQVKQAPFPSWCIHRAFVRYRQVAAKTEAGDLTDIHLLCHAPYVDMFFVDKRTHENVRRVRGKDPRAAAFMASVQRAPTWNAAVDAAARLLQGERPRRR